MIVWSYILSLLLLTKVAISQIDVQLQANWEALPFELQLLETIASENESYYIPTALKIASVDVDDELGKNEFSDDQSLYESVFSQLTVSERSLYDIALANKYYSPRIVSHYNYYNNTVLGQYKSQLLAKCGKTTGSWLQYNDIVYCNPDDVYALMTDERNSDDDSILLPFDRVIGSSGPILILYSNVKEPNFKQFFGNLYESAEHGKIRFVWRYAPRNIDEREILAGYGVDLTLKRTDYIVIDDRDIGEVQKTKHKRQEVLKEHDSFTSFFDIYNDNIIAISKSEIEDLDYRLASFALSSDNDTINFERLLKVVQDLPKYSSFLSDFDPEDGLLKQVEHNTRLGLSPENPGIFLNGLILDDTHQDVYSLYNLLKQEQNAINDFKQLGFSTKESRLIMGKFALLSLIKERRYPQSRYDLTGSAVTYFNDIENDSAYKKLSSDTSIYLQRYQMGQIPPLRQNIHDLIFVINLSDEEQLETFKEISEVILSKKIPQRVGLVPLLHSDEDKVIANNFYYYEKNYGTKKALKYLYKMDLDGVESLTEEDLCSGPINEFTSQFDIQTASIIVNGVIYELTEQWPYYLTQQLTQDVNLITGMIYTGRLDDDGSIRDILYEDALKFRDLLVVPENRATLEHRILSPEVLKELEVSKNDVLEFLSGDEESEVFVTLTIGGNFGSKLILQQLIEVLRFSKTSEANLKIRLINISDEATFIGKIHQSLNKSIDHAIEVINKIIEENIFTELDENLPLKQSLKSAGISAKSFVLLSGRYIELNDKVIGQRSLEYLFDFELKTRISSAFEVLKQVEVPQAGNKHDWYEFFISKITKTFYKEQGLINTPLVPRLDFSSIKNEYSISFGDQETSDVHITVVVDPAAEAAQKLLSLIQSVKNVDFVSIDIILQPKKLEELSVKRFFRGNYKSKVKFLNGNIIEDDFVSFDLVPENTLFTLDLDTPSSWIVVIKESASDLDNVLLSQTGAVTGIYELKNIIIEGNALDVDSLKPPTGLSVQIEGSDTNVMTNYGYLQLKANPGLWEFEIKEGKSSDIYSLLTIDDINNEGRETNKKLQVDILDMDGKKIYPRVIKNPGRENDSLIVLENEGQSLDAEKQFESSFLGKLSNKLSKTFSGSKKQADINIFTIASGHLYERFLSIMTASVMRHTKHTVKFWLIENYMSPSFKEFLPHLAEKYGFEYELINYKWPSWLRGQREKQRTIWGYKILFLDVLFPQDLDKVIFVDADQIVRTDLQELVDIDLQGAPYGYTPMCDSRTEMEGFRFWKQGYWEKFLGENFKYHISALYVIDLKKFREIAAGDRLRQRYQALSRDPNSLSNLDQDLPNNMQTQLKIFSLPQEWLWCETWCDDQSLKKAKTIDLCNNPLTKEPKLDRARRQIPEWTKYDDEIAELRDKISKPLKPKSLKNEDNHNEKTDSKSATSNEHDEL